MVTKTTGVGFPLNQSPEIAPRRTRSKEILIEKFSELGELCVSAVNTCSQKTRPHAGGCRRNSQKQPPFRPWCVIGGTTFQSND